MSGVLRLAETHSNPGRGLVRLPAGSGAAVQSGQLASRPKARRRLPGLLPVVLLLASLATAASGEPPATVRGARSLGPVVPVLTGALRDLPQVAAAGPERQVLDPAARHRSSRPNAGVRSGAGPGPTIEILLNIDGQGDTGELEPFVIGDVGPNHYVQAVEPGRVAVYDKAGNLLPGFPVDLETLAPSGPCAPGSGHRDQPIVLYDWLADRWVLGQRKAGTLCVFVSATPDPTGTYNVYPFSFGGVFIRPRLAVWSDAYYGSLTYLDESDAVALDRAAMLAGAPATGQAIKTFKWLMPADHDGNPAPPPGTPGLFVQAKDGERSGPTDLTSDDLLLFTMDVDFTTPENTTLTPLTTLPITDFNSALLNYSSDSVPQTGSSERLDAIRDMVYNRLAYRNFGAHEALVGAFLENRDPTTPPPYGIEPEHGLRWFELRRTGGGAWALHDEGTFGGDTDSPTAHFLLGTPAMDGQGNIALGYNKTDVGAVTVFPSVGFAGRLATDPPGTFGAENDVVLGEGPYESFWGPQAAMGIDPVDDCTFWLTHAHVESPGVWATRITAFRFGECVPGFLMTPSPSFVGVCVPSDPDPQLDVEVVSTGGWSYAAELTSSGEPAGTSPAFAPNNQAPDFTSVYTLNGSAAASPGLYPIDVQGVGSDVPTTQRSAAFVVEVAAAAPGAPTSVAPADGASGVERRPILSWGAAADAAFYDVEVAADPAFTSLVHTAIDLTGMAHQLPLALDLDTTYYWRVTARNACGMATGATFSFTTERLSCEIFASADVPKSVSGGTKTSTLSTDLNRAIVDLDLLDLRGDHDDMGDLDFFLESPAATEVNFRRQACSLPAAAFHLEYDDEALPGVPPCPPEDGGTYPPDDPLAAFSGEIPAGLWTMRVVDSVPGPEVGQLDSWSLRLCSLPCDASRDVVLESLIVSEAEVREACNSMVVGDGVTVEATGTLDVFSPVTRFLDGVSVAGTVSVTPN